MQPSYAKHIHGLPSIDFALLSRCRGACAMTCRRVSGSPGRTFTRLMLKLQGDRNVPCACAMRPRTTNVSELVGGGEVRYRSVHIFTSGAFFVASTFFTSAKSSRGPDLYASSTLSGRRHRYVFRHAAPCAATGTINWKHSRALRERESSFNTSITSGPVNRAQEQSNVARRRTT